MKYKLFFLFFVAIISTYGYSQPPKNMISRNRLPQLVKESFDAKYPDAMRASWKNENPNEFEVELVLENVTNWITYNEFGVVLFTKKALKEEELPELVKQTLQGAFKDFKVSSRKKVEHTTKGESYEMAINRQIEKYIVSIDPNGNILSKTAVLE